MMLMSSSFSLRLGLRMLVIRASSHSFLSVVVRSWKWKDHKMLLLSCVAVRLMISFLLREGLGFAAGLEREMALKSLHFWKLILVANLSQRVSASLSVTKSWNLIGVSWVLDELGLVVAAMRFLTLEGCLLSARKMYAIFREEVVVSTKDESGMISWISFLICSSVATSGQCSRWYLTSGGSDLEVDVLMVVLLLASSFGLVMVGVVVVSSLLISSLSPSIVSSSSVWFGEC